MSKERERKLKELNENLQSGKKFFIQLRLIDVKNLCFHLSPQNKVEKVMKERFSLEPRWIRVKAAAQCQQVQAFHQGRMTAAELERPR